MNEVEEIKEKIDIVEVISSYLTLKKAGANLKARCPFHHEKSPSFMVSPERQTFKCFGCNEGGDVFTFVEKIEGIDFYNALKLLAERAGIELKKTAIAHAGRDFKPDQKTKIFEINDWTKKLYHKILVDHPKAHHARAYLEQRGLSEKTIKEFEIGYAPDSWELLVNFLTQKEYSKEEMQQAGVVIRSEQNRYYDRFRARIIFPINNIMGLTVAFTSRLIKDDPKQAKYINSSESPIYIKGKTIYGLDKAKLVIKEKNLAILVEGNMDVVACHQAGYRNVIATSGTALTEEQLKILNRYSEEIAFCFDTDEAGQTALKRAIKLAMKNDINTKVIAVPPPYKDPDEVIKANPKTWERACHEAKPSLEYWIDFLIRKHPDLSISDKKNITKEILPVIKAAFSEIEKEYYIKYLSKKLSISEKSLFAVIEKTKDDSDFNKSEKKNIEHPAKSETWQVIFAILWSTPELLSEIKNEFDNFTVPDAELALFSNMIAAKNIDKLKITPASALILDQLALKNLSNLTPESLKDELKYQLARFRSHKLENTKALFAAKIRDAEEKGDKNELKKLLSEFSTLLK